MHTATVHAVTVAAATAASTAASAAATTIDIAAAAAANDIAAAAGGGGGGGGAAKGTAASPPSSDAISTNVAVDAIPATQRHRCDVLLPHLREWIRTGMIPSYRVGDERV